MSKASREFDKIMRERERQQRKRAEQHALEVDQRAEATAQVLRPLLQRIIDELPLEAIACIVSFLPLDERSRLACVHRYFFEASLHWTLWEPFQGPLRPGEMRLYCSVDWSRRVVDRVFYERMVRVRRNRLRKVPRLASYPVFGEVHSSRWGLRGTSGLF